MIKEQVQTLLNLFQQAPETTRRLNVCMKCPFLRPESMKCIKCGCHLKLKVRFESEHCPIDKW